MQDVLCSIIFGVWVLAIGYWGLAIGYWGLAIGAVARSLLNPFRRSYPFEGVLAEIIKPVADFLVGEAPFPVGDFLVGEALEPTGNTPKRALCRKHLGGDRRLQIEDASGTFDFSETKATSVGLA
ncbi:MAG: hypothetical protein R3D00_18100 [Bacteroidia bacterium]